MKLYEEIHYLTRLYSRNGGKTNRRQQSKRILTFIDHCYRLGVRSTGQIGKKHVIKYWKENRYLAPSTAYNHWLALCALWRLLDKEDLPPRPRSDEK